MIFYEYIVYSIQYTIVHPSSDAATDLFLLSEPSELRRIWGSREHSSTDIHHQHGWVASGYWPRTLLRPLLNNLERPLLNNLEVFEV